MGITSKPQIHMYWSTDSILSTPIFPRLMRRDRFEQIRTMIHFTHPLSENVKNPLTRTLWGENIYVLKPFTEYKIPSKIVLSLMDGLEGLMVCRWSDCYKTSSKKIVSMMSTKHTGLLVETGKVDYRSKANIFKPDVIVEYNKTMGGVDTLSGVINPYSIQLKGLKWYRKVAELFIDISIYNSFVIWQNLNRVIGTHLDFRKK